MELSGKKTLFWVQAFHWLTSSKKQQTSAFSISAPASRPRVTALELMLSVKDSHRTNEGCKCWRNMELLATTEQDKDDFRHFDVIFAFDESNVRGLNETFKPNDGTARA